MQAEVEVRESAPFELFAAMAAVVLAGFATAAAFPAADPVARVLMMAVAAGLLAAWLTDWRVCVAAAVASALVFVGFLTHRYGALTGNPAPWDYTPLIGLAGLIGGLGRRMIHAVPAPRAEDPPRAVARAREMAPPATANRGPTARRTRRRARGAMS